jgi:hypothetical protein
VPVSTGRAYPDIPHTPGPDIFYCRPANARSRAFMVELSFPVRCLPPFFRADFSCKVKCLAVVWCLSGKFVFNLKVRFAP